MYIIVYIYIYTYYKSTVTFLQLTSTCLDLACLRYDAAMTMRNRRCLQAWIHIEDFLGMCMGRFLKGKTWEHMEKTYHLHFMLTVWTFTSRIPWNWPQRHKPDRPWASRTPSLIILTSPGCSCEAGYVYYVQCKFEVSVLFSFCPSAAWLFDGIFDGQLNFRKLWSWFATLVFPMCMAWFCI